MNEPQITNYFNSKEEENKFYVEAGKAERTAEILAMVDEVIEKEKRDYGFAVSFNPWADRSEDKNKIRILSEFCNQLKARIKEAAND